MVFIRPTRHTAAEKKEEPVKTASDPTKIDAIDEEEEEDGVGLNREGIKADYEGYVLVKPQQRTSETPVVRCLDSMPLFIA